MRKDQIFTQNAIKKKTNKQKTECHSTLNELNVIFKCVAINVCIFLIVAQCIVLYYFYMKQLTSLSK